MRSNPPTPTLTYFATQFTNGHTRRVAISLPYVACIADDPHYAAPPPPPEPEPPVPKSLRPPRWSEKVIRRMLGRDRKHTRSSSTGSAMRQRCGGSTAATCELRPSDDEGSIFRSGVAHDMPIRACTRYRFPKSEFLFRAWKGSEIGKQAVVLISRGLQIQSPIPNVMDMSFNWKFFSGFCVVIPADEKHVIILLVVERCKQIFVVPLASLPIKSMFKGVPIVALSTVQLLDVHIRMFFKHVAGERFAANLCEVLNNLTAAASQAEH